MHIISQLLCCCHQGSAADLYLDNDVPIEEKGEQGDRGLPGIDVRFLIVTIKIVFTIYIYIHTYIYT